VPSIGSETSYVVQSAPPYPVSQMHLPVVLLHVPWFEHPSMKLHIMAPVSHSVSPVPL
jgi:hypothetical protein